MNLRSVRKLFARSPANFRPMVRWLWNDHLDPDHLAEQMDQLLGMGMGGALIRPAAGLPEGVYLSDRWFEAVLAVARRARKQHASLWIAEDFDDPFSQKIVAELLRETPSFAAQALRMEEIPAGASFDPAGVIAAFSVSSEANGVPAGFVLADTAAVSADAAARRVVFRAQAAPGRLRVFEPAATRALLDRTHGLYREHAKKYFGNTIGLSMLLGAALPEVAGGVPWDDELPALFHETYGYALAPSLPALFYDVPNSAAVREDFWTMIDELFLEGFDVPFRRWAEEQGILHAVTTAQAGHLSGSVVQSGRAMLRQSMHSFTAMRLDGDADKRLALLEARSVRRQCGIEGVIAMAPGGANAMQVMAEGVNFLCGRTVASSLRGARKLIGTPLVVPADKDLHTRAAADAEARFAWMLGQGRTSTPLLVLHPHGSLQASYRAGEKAPSELHKAIAEHFRGIVCALSDADIEFDVADELLLAKHGTAVQRVLQAGKTEYRAVLLPPLITIRTATLELLHDFVMGGGLVVSAGSLPELIDGRGSDRVVKFFDEYGERIVQGIDFSRYHAVVDRLRRANLDVRLAAKSASQPRLLVQESTWEDMKITGIHNVGPDRIELAPPESPTRTEVWDPATGAMTPPDPWARAMPAGASVLLVTSPEPAETAPAMTWIEETRQSPAWTVKRLGNDYAVLDRCAIIENSSLIAMTAPEARTLLGERIAANRGPVPLRTRWTFAVPAGATLDGCSLVTELSAGASIMLDGADLSTDSEKTVLDPAFTVIDLPSLGAGEHIIEIWRTYAQAGDLQSPWLLGDFKLEPITGFFGQLSYVARVDGFQPGPARRVELRIPGTLPGPVMVRLDNAVAGWILAPHDRLDITESWRTGARTIEIVTQYPADRLLAQLAGRPADAGPALSPPVIVTLAQRVSA